MKVGDLVMMPTRREKFGIEAVGLVAESKVVRNRIGILWSDGGMKIDYEPIKLLEVINHG